MTARASIARRRSHGQDMETSQDIAVVKLEDKFSQQDVYAVLTLAF
jgi:hypothetical protein